MKLPFSLLVLLFCCACEFSSVEENTSPPNIILILGDDMGFSDIGCYGGEIRTPHLDSLAANGLRFTQFYNTARCCPTRASLLTGLYPQQAGIGHMVNDRGTPAYQGDLSFNAVTIAEVLKTAGYATYLSGKWHVTPYVKDNPDQKNWPLQRGFDQFFGMIAGAGSLYDPRSLAEGNAYVAPREDFYCTTDFTNYALECINNSPADQPFFLYLAYTAAHWPMHAPEAAVKSYKGHYNKGWDILREERLNKLRTLGLVDQSLEMTPRDSLIPAWTDSIPDRDWELANMEVYAAMVDLMDEGIGAIVAALEQKGILDHTLILYLQDNGACAEELDWVDWPPAGRVTGVPMPEGALQTEMIPPVTRDGKPVELMKAAFPGPPESYTAYGRNWANFSNTPFREYKHWVHEGGIATPLIAHWPAQITDKGALRHTPTHLIDIMATCVDIGQAAYPSSFNGNAITPLEGKSLMPVFQQDSLERTAIYWEHEGNRAVRMGKWKLVAKADRNSFIWDTIEELDLQDWELFNMEIDRSELNNLAAQEPELVSKMAQMWMDWAKASGTIPRPN